MQVDDHTLRDLEIFRTDDGTASLFDRLDRTLTAGGREALRRRYRSPVSDPAGIRAVQSSVAYLIEHPELVALLPDEDTIVQLRGYLESNYDTGRRLHGPLASLDHFLTRVRYRDFYRAAVNGVQLTHRALARIHMLAEELQEHSAPGELAVLTADMLSRLADDEIGVLLLPRTGNARGSAAIRLDSWVRDRCRDRLNVILARVYAIDALFSMAIITREKGYALPVVDETVTLHIKGVRHPFLKAAVPNDVVLGAEESLMLLTGPNMAGKTTYLKACGCAVFLAHLGMGVPVESMRFRPAHSLFTSLRVADSLNRGVSYFQAEARRVKAAAELLTRNVHVVVLFDELFRGTNIRDALDASERVLRAFAHAPHGTVVVSSHLIELVDALAAEHGVVLRYFDATVGNGALAFDYRLKEGVSSQRLGMAVLEQEGVLGVLEQLQHPDA